MEAAGEDADIECINKPLKSTLPDEASASATSHSGQLTSDIQEKDLHPMATCDKMSPSPSSSSSSQVTSEQDEDSLAADAASSDVLIMKQLNEMKLILQQLLQEKECSFNDSSSVNRMTSPSMLPECLGESTLSDSDLTLIACMRHLYPLSGMCEMQLLVLLLLLLPINRSTYCMLRVRSMCYQTTRPSAEYFQGDPLR